MSKSATRRKKRILIFCDFYLPSTKSGGGMWTVVNLVDRFCDRYDFFVVTRNYDSKGDTQPFTTVKTGEWNRVGNASVYYVQASDLNGRTAAERVREIRPDGVLLNSAFSTPVVNFLEARRRGLIDKVPVVLAPCGEFSAGALTVKPLKKKLFIAYAKAVGLFKGVVWKASSELEHEEIRKVLGRELEPLVAPDLAPKSILPDFSLEMKPVKESGSASFVFFSRVVPKKNIRYFLERLTEVRGGQVTFNIAGPLEDLSYWADCRRIIESMPRNVEVKTLGAVSYQEGLKLLCQHHFFVLPTLNENFGYVILESLAAGSPILISDRTMWGSVQTAGAGWAIPLEDQEAWSAYIKRCIEMDNGDFLEMSAAAREFAESYLAKGDIERPTADVLEHAFGRFGEHAVQAI
jgi:glycosyltransferase involved in cell wall biosynthesis